MLCDIVFLAAGCIVITSGEHMGNSKPILNHHMTLLGQLESRAAGKSVAVKVSDDG